jgi:CheY-like chemotaxis protein
MAKWAPGSVMPSLRVMIVEDEPLIAMAMEMIVEDAGGQPTGTHSTVKEALAAVSSELRIDVALIDCNLGKESAWPVAEALAKRNVPFAFTSGQGIKDMDPRFADRPVFAKPVEEEKLKRFLRQYSRMD